MLHTRHHKNYNNSDSKDNSDSEDTKVKSVFQEIIKAHCGEKKKNLINEYCNVNSKYKEEFLSKIESFLYAYQSQESREITAKELYSNIQKLDSFQGIYNLVILHIDIVSTYHKTYIHLMTLLMQSTLNAIHKEYQNSAPTLYEKGYQNIIHPPKLEKEYQNIIRQYTNVNSEYFNTYEYKQCENMVDQCISQNHINSIDATQCARQIFDHMLKHRNTYQTHSTYRSYVHIAYLDKLKTIYINPNKSKYQVKTTNNYEASTSDTTYTYEEASIHSPRCNNDNVESTLQQIKTTYKYGLYPISEHPSQESIDSLQYNNNDNNPNTTIYGMKNQHINTEQQNSLFQSWS